MDKKEFVSELKKLVSEGIVYEENFLDIFTVYVKTKKDIYKVDLEDLDIYRKSEAGGLIDDLEYAPSWYYSKEEKMEIAKMKLDILEKMLLDKKKHLEDIKDEIVSVGEEMKIVGKFIRR